MAGIDWNAPLPTGGGAGHQSVEEMFPEVFGGGGGSAPSARPAPAPAATVEQRPAVPASPRVETPAPAAPVAGRRFETSDLPRSEYENMPIRDVVSRGLSNALPSAGNALSGLYDAVTNYEDTASTLNQLGKGVASKVRGALGGERNMEAEAMADAVGQMYKDRYGSAAAIKEALAEDPFSIGMDAASVAPVIGIAGRAAGLGKLATGVEKIAALGDPLNVAAQGARLGTKAAMLPVTTVGRYAQGAASGTPFNALKLAEKAGRSTDPMARSVFRSFAAGNGDGRDIAQAATAAMKEKIAQASANYTRRKAALTNQELSLGDVRTTLNDLRTRLDPFGTRAGMADVNALNRMEALVRTYEAHPDPNSRTAVQLDLLKRDLRDMVEELPPSQRGALAEVPRSVRDTIAKVDSGYADMMDYWQNWMRQMRDLQATLGTGDRVAETSQIARLMSSMKNNDKLTLLQELADTPSGKYLPYMIAGASTAKWAPPYLQGMGLAGVGAMLAGGPHGTAAIVAGSPRLAGLTQYAAGRAQGAVGKLPKYTSYAAPASNVLSQIGQDRIGRKAGGRVGIDHDKLADQLVTAAERAKKGISKGTEQLLDLPDDHIAHALEVANRSI